MYAMYYEMCQFSYMEMLSRACIKVTLLALMHKSVMLFTSKPMKVTLARLQLDK